MFTLLPARAVLSGGVQAAALGLDIKAGHAKLLKPLIWTQHVGAEPDGTVAVFLHRADDGGWGLQHAVVSRGRMTLRTTDWSFQVPSWLNPEAWAQWVGQHLTATIAGTTSPWICPNVPNWMAVINYATTVHACAQKNDLGSVQRGEIRIESNRGYFQQVTLPGNLARDYVWVSDQTDAVRYLLSAATHTDQGTVIFLPPGSEGLMTAGYRRPASAGAQQGGTIQVQTTYDSIALDVIFNLVDAVAGGGLDHYVEQGATAYILGKCSGVLGLAEGALHSPWDAASGSSFGSVFSCMATQVAEQLKDPAKALAAARSLDDPSYSHILEGEYADQLVSLGKKLYLLGAILWARPLLQQGWVGSYDQLVNIWQQGRLSDIAVDMAGPRATPIIPPSAGGSPAPTSPTSTSPTSPTGPSPTPGGGVAETVGGNANTWTNYTDAGGNQGLTIPAYTTVQIACKIQGFEVADGNTWWYRIESSPWNNQYYVSADAFYNNGQTSGSLVGTPWVDPTVPDCTTGIITPPPPPSTWSETVGGNAHTWTNYTNAGGTEGPTIPAYTTVQIACKIQGFKVADGNTWWYRIESSPWNNQYYVSADAFYNNGQTSGSLVGTPFVDPAVANC